MSKKSGRETAEAIILRLQQADYEAFLAGGCVRDLLLGQEPKDYDVATNATPDDICKLYPKAQRVGAHFGVVIVQKYGYMVEVATFRTDHAYRDGRHPEKVVFSTMEEDAQRRDFTINGMFYDVANDRVIDLVNGQQDLEKKLVQAIGNPEKRFEEDHLRMLRAVRFAAHLGFEIEQETFEAIYNRSAMIERVSRERIREELERILCSPHRARGFTMLRDTGLIAHLWPDAQWSTTSLENSRRALAALPSEATFPLALATTLYQRTVQELGDICRALTCSNDVLTKVRWMSKGLSSVRADKVQTLADLKLLMAGPSFPDLESLLRACLVADGQPLTAAEDLGDRARAVPAEDVAPHPWVTGQDLLDMGLQEGPIFGRILHEVYYRQLNLDLPGKDEALHLARRLADVAESHTPKGEKGTEG